MEELARPANLYWVSAEVVQFSDSRIFSITKPHYSRPERRFSAMQKSGRVAGRKDGNWRRSNPPESQQWYINSGH